ncbi:ankyrin repeat domain-containing protein [Desulfovibrio sp. Huiquan2017]|uniref:ankyrin repeat domain-containing protein n=1 Tax=Desulfovibrio sp. Huiquan2017 TaxID=2816861 RepID=UPI001A936064|nr:ankyrin repeat domain-containing protein [Desulfovibrio sp. Huiquan2017]
MGKLNCALLVILMLSSSACAFRNPEGLPLYAMHVREMFPGDMKAQALALAAADGDVERMDRLVARGADVNARGTYGVTLPTWVIQHPNKEGFRRLMELGSDPNIHWNDGDTLLHWICRVTDDVGVQYLQMALEIGRGDPNVERPSNGNRPIEYAVAYLKKYRHEAFALLYNAGAEIDYKNKYDVPLVDRAVTAGAFEIAFFLLTQGVDYSSTNKMGDVFYSIKSSYIKDADGTKQYPSSLWFWRCVDFLEKKGMSFDFLPQEKRPAVLDTTPPGILKLLNRR